MAIMRRHTQPENFAIGANNSRYVRTSEADRRKLLVLKLIALRTSTIPSLPNWEADYKQRRSLTMFLDLQNIFFRSFESLKWDSRKGG
jgi:hypothetical protein